MAVAIMVAACSGETRITEPSAPTKLVFTVHPTDAAGAQPITPAVVVAVQDASGNTVVGATPDVTLALGPNATGARLSGTLTVSAKDGVATFSNLRVDRPGSGYTLEASASQLDGASSNGFAVTITFASVSAGGAHTCGVTPEGVAYCWGANDHGQLGAITGLESCASLICSTVPIPVHGDLTFAAVSAGSFHTCGITPAGTAYCWGANVNGQLGDGTFDTPRTTPVRVVGALTFTAVSAGSFHTCGLATEGALHCWGENFRGELGDGTRTTDGSPVRVLGEFSFAAVEVGKKSCGATTDGAGLCWGWNNYGLLGIGTSTGPEDCSGLPCSTVPLPVEGGLTFSALSGDFHTCGLTPSGTAYCWGPNGLGQLGAGTTAGPEYCDNPGSSEPHPCSTQPVAVLGAMSFAVVSAGHQHTCGATAAGTAYCWGHNGSGQLGIGSATALEDCAHPDAAVEAPCSSVPVAVEGGQSLATVSAGGAHTCGVTSAGIAYCWGGNGGGALGVGHSTGPDVCPGWGACSTVPVKVMGQP